MAGNSSTSNKAKLARRVIEVLDFFDDHHREATVMDIVRRYDRPQSSTSELLSSLVELGLLAKDPHARSYRLTARAALLGLSGQPEALRDGRLISVMDRLCAQTGLSVGLFAMAGLNAQLIAWRATAPRPGQPHTGHQEPLCQSASGWLLLSTIEPNRRTGMLRRLHAEAASGARFDLGELAARIEKCGHDRHTFGPAGFGSKCEALSLLVPAEVAEQPLVVSIFLGRNTRVNTTSLLHSARDTMRRCLEAPASAPLAAIHSAA
ncbi:MAG: helix-turn-helix domain-containing protein [Novosphingobium sp.]|nr:helix-turn-helix domain-containing protein [Novosphingobium sp.]